ncbi:MAG: hypothetical protein A07HB70_01981, partial [uncultured archaeon A07HB70]
GTHLCTIGPAPATVPVGAHRATPRLTSPPPARRDPESPHDGGIRDDDDDSRDRVRLASETPDAYDRGFYRDRAVRAAASVLSPFGWRRERIERALADETRTRLDAH